jgi:hypothetical protein
MRMKRSRLDRVLLSASFVVLFFNGTLVGPPSLLAVDFRSREAGRSRMPDGDTHPNSGHVP